MRELLMPVFVWKNQHREVQDLIEDTAGVKEGPGRLREAQQLEMAFMSQKKKNSLGLK